MEESHMSEFEFAFKESVEEKKEEDFEEQTSEFPGIMDELVDKSEVLIFTDSYRIRGKIALVPGARLTDYIVEANLFIAVTEVKVTDKEGKLLFKTPFLNVHRDHIELILPAELATFS
jgi:hypothetical protein